MQKSSRKRSVTPRDSESIRRYFSEISSYPVLSREEEQCLAVRMNSGDEEAFQKLVMANSRFVVHVAKDFLGRKLSFEDLVAEGNIGLIKAVRRFDPGLGIRLISYAKPWIKESMLLAIAEVPLIRLPANQRAVRNKINSAIAALQQLLGRKPTPAEIADHTNINEDQIVFYFDHCSDLCNLEDQAGEGSKLTLLETMEDPMFMAPDLILEKKDLRPQVLSSLNRLPGGSGAVIILFFGLDCKAPMSIRGIAGHLGLCMLTVQNRKITGLRNLRNKAKMARFHNYLYELSLVS